MSENKIEYDATLSPEIMVLDRICKQATGEVIDRVKTLTEISAQPSKTIPGPLYRLMNHFSADGETSIFWAKVLREATTCRRLARESRADMLRHLGEICKAPAEDLDTIAKAFADVEHRACLYILNLVLETL